MGIRGHWRERWPARCVGNTNRQTCWRPNPIPTWTSRRPCGTFPGRHWLRSASRVDVGNGYAAWFRGAIGAQAVMAKQLSGASQSAVSRPRRSRMADRWWGGESQSRLAHYSAEVNGLLASTSLSVGFTADGRLSSSSFMPAAERCCPAVSCARVTSDRAQFTRSVSVRRIHPFRTSAAAVQERPQPAADSPLFRSPGLADRAPPHGGEPHRDLRSRLGRRRRLGWRAVAGHSHACGGRSVTIRASRSSFGPCRVTVTAFCSRMSSRNPRTRRCGKRRPRHPHHHATPEADVDEIDVLIDRLLSAATRPPMRIGATRPSSCIRSERQRRWRV